MFHVSNFFPNAVELYMNNSDVPYVSLPKKGDLARKKIRILKISVS